MTVDQDGAPTAGPAWWPAEVPRRTLLGVWAHPDDETWLSSGLMAQACAAGMRVVCVTATRGENGSTDPDRWRNGPELAAVRTAELEAALARLGPIEHHWLDHPDGGCADVPDEVGAAQVAAIMSDVGPDVVLTFGPDGMTAHADHQAVFRWTDRARRLACPDARLLLAIHSTEFLIEHEQTFREFGAFMDDAFVPPRCPHADLDVLLRLSGSELDQKYDALTAQRSQIDVIVESAGAAYVRTVIAEESFVAAERFPAWP